METLSKIEGECSSTGDTDRSGLAETVIARLILYFDDPYIKLRPILLGE